MKVFIACILIYHWQLPDWLYLAAVVVGGASFFYQTTIISASGTDVMKGDIKNITVAVEELKEVIVHGNYRAPKRGND
jgi:hypothetical protein